MSDEYQLRKDIDGIYRKFYDYQRQQWNVITSDDLQEALDNLPTGGGDVSGDYITESELNQILSSYVVSSTLSSYALKSEIVTSYDDLTDKPYIPSKTSDLTNDSGFLTSHQSLRDYLTESEINQLLSSYALSSQLNNYYTKTEADNRYSQIGHSHNINDVTNLQSTLNSKVNTNDLSDVAFSNDYSDLDNIPSSFTPSSHTHTKSQITDLSNATTSTDGLMSSTDKTLLNSSTTIKQLKATISVSNNIMYCAITDSSLVTGSIVLVDFSDITLEQRATNYRQVMMNVNGHYKQLYSQGFGTSHIAVTSYQLFGTKVLVIIEESEVNCLKLLSHTHSEYATETHSHTDREVISTSAHSNIGSARGDELKDILTDIDTVLGSKANNSDLPTIDSALSISSSNPVQNSVITNAINDLSDQSFGGTMYDIRVYDYTNNTKGNEIYNANIDQKLLVEIIPYSFSGIAKQLPSQNIDVDIVDKSGASTVTATGYDDLATGVMSWRYVYTCSQWGQCRFSIKTYSSFISVQGYRETVKTDNISTGNTLTYTLREYEKECVLRLSGTGLDFPTSMTILTSTIVPWRLRPLGIHSQFNYINRNTIVSIRPYNNVVEINRRSMTGSQLTNQGIYCSFEWKKAV